jgi:UTP--glucose-1-phosphate uridylyltransferase
VYLRQKGPYGNATPILEAKKVVGEEPFCVLWGDEMIRAKPSRLEQCLATYEEYGKGVVSALEVDESVIPGAGVGRVEEVGPLTYRLLEIVEKPAVDAAPSRLMCSGVYIFNPDVFPVLEELKPGKDGEVWLVDAINALAREGKMMAREIDGGVFYNVGSKASYLKTVVDFMLLDPEMGEEMRAYVEGKLKI